MKKKKKPQDETVGRRKQQDDKLKARLAKIEKFLNLVAPGWRAV